MGIWITVGIIICGLIACLWYILANQHHTEHPNPVAQRPEWNNRFYGRHADLQITGDTSLMQAIPPVPERSAYLKQVFSGDHDE